MNEARSSLPIKAGKTFLHRKVIDYSMLYDNIFHYAKLRSRAFFAWRTNGTFKKLKEGIEDGSFRKMWREAKWMFVYNDFFSENFYMKKPVCLLLVFALAFAMSAGAFAENVVSPEKDNTNVDVDDEPSSSPGPVTAARFAMSLPQCFLRSELLHLV